MANYIINQSGITVAPEGNINVEKSLPSGVYTIVIEPMQPIRLQKIDPFTIPDHLYGKTREYSERIINTFLSREKSTGVLLVGTKGSGKTLLARNISRVLYFTHHISTIIVSFNQISQEVADFIESISTPCMVLFDEIDKVEERTATDCLLGIFDGISNTKKLWILTANDPSEINDKFVNRPGRIYYRMVFGGVPREAIDEYCRENMKNHAFIPEVHRVAMYVREFSFDILQAVVEESNRYDISPLETMQFLNVEPDLSGYFKITAINKNGHPVTLDDDTLYFSFCPGYLCQINIDDNDLRMKRLNAIGESEKNNIDEEEVKCMGQVEIRFEPMDYKDMKDGSLLYEVDGYKLICSQTTPRAFSFREGC